MPLSLTQIKDKLLQGLDEDNNTTLLLQKNLVHFTLITSIITQFTARNKERRHFVFIDVTDVGIVEEVITALEVIAPRITREDLETTRLAKYINDLRKKTGDKELAGRSRKLIKLWQPLVSGGRPNNVSPALSYTPSASPGLQPIRWTGIHSNNASPALSNCLKLSPALPHLAGRSLSPTVNSSKLVTSPAINNSSQSQSKKGSRNSSPAFSVGSRQVSPAFSSARSRTPNDRISTAEVSSKHSSVQSSYLHGKPVSPASSSLRSVTPTISSKQYSYHTQPDLSIPIGHNGTVTQDTNGSSHASNRKRRRSDESVNSEASSAKKVRMVNGDGPAHRNLATERTRTPKVKTTVQLIAELAQQKASLTASDTITKIVTNQIHKEKDDISISVVPAGARPRPRKKPGISAVSPPEAPPATLRQTKSDLVHRFLYSSVEHQNSPSSANSSLSARQSEVDELEILGLDNTDHRKPATKINTTYDTSIDPYSLLPPINYDEIIWSDDDGEDGPPRLNPITGEYPSDYEQSQPQEFVDNSHVHKILTNDWHGVNGTMSSSSQFHPWTDTFSIQRTDQEDDVYVLPYVDIE